MHYLIYGWTRHDLANEFRPIWGIRKQSQQQVDQLVGGKVDERARFQQVSDVDEGCFHDFGEIAEAQPVRHKGDDVDLRDVSTCKNSETPHSRLSR